MHEKIKLITDKFAGPDGDLLSFINDAEMDVKLDCLNALEECGNIDPRLSLLIDELDEYQKIRKEYDDAVAEKKEFDSSYQSEISNIEYEYNKKALAYEKSAL